MMDMNASEKKTGGSSAEGSKAHKAVETIEAAKIAKAAKVPKAAEAAKIAKAAEVPKITKTATAHKASKVPKRFLDELLVERGVFSSTDEVLRAVVAREVRVDDVYVASARVKVRENADIYVRGRKRYVSRGGYKLQGALDSFGQDVHGLRCLDIGSSTGGFTDCLLQAGAASVACVDVNYGQLAWQLRQDERVTAFERTNIRTANPAALGAPFDLIVIDVSFIGLAALAEVFPAFSQVGTVFIGLVKPQFESRHEETDRGVVRDETVRLRTVDEVRRALESVGFKVSGVIESPIHGAQGNVEYLVRAVYGARVACDFPIAG